MHYFIYPKGGHGRTLGEMVKFLQKDVEITFIDDAYPEISLANQKEEILLSGDKVLLALEQKNPYSRIIMEKLIKNLQDTGITNYSKAVLWYSVRIVEFAKKELKKMGWSRENTIGVGVYNHAGEKHLGFVDEELKRQGFNVLYLCSNDKSYNAYSQKNAFNSFAIPLVIEHFDLVDFIFGVYMTTPLNFRNPKVKYFYQPHGIADMCESILRFGGIEESMEILRHTDYIMAPTKKEVTILLKAMQEYYLKGEIVSAGYPAFEIVQEQLLGCKEIAIRDSLFVAVSYESDLIVIKEAVKLLLENAIKIIFRPRPFWGKQNVDNFINSFANSPYFSVDNEDKISARSYQTSFAVLTTASSVGYTYPLITFCPSILYFEEDYMVQRKWREYAYFDPILHMYANSPKKLLEIVLDAKENVAKNQQKIQAYKDEQIFNVGSASAFIAQTIKEISKDLV